MSRPARLYPRRAGGRPHRLGRRHRGLRAPGGSRAARRDLPRRRKHAGRTRLRAARRPPRDGPRRRGPDRHLACRLPPRRHDRTEARRATARRAARRHVGARRGRDDDGGRTARARHAVRRIRLGRRRALDDRRQRAASVRARRRASRRRRGRACHREPRHDVPCGRRHPRGRLGERRAGLARRDPARARGTHRIPACARDGRRGDPVASRLSDPPRDGGVWRHRAPRSRNEDSRRRAPRDARDDREPARPVHAAEGRERGARREPGTVSRPLHGGAPRHPPERSRGSVRVCEPAVGGDLGLPRAGEPGLRLGRSRPSRRPGARLRVAARGAGSRTPLVLRVSAADARGPGPLGPRPRGAPRLGRPACSPATSRPSRT